MINTLENENLELNHLFQSEDMIYVKDLNIHNCIGCNSCWIKTPGKCAIKDDFEELFKKIVKAVTVVFITDEKMGMVNYQLKNIIDRMIALDLPFTCIKDGQARHAARYDKKWNFMLVLSKTENFEYLDKWFRRVTINFHSNSLGTFSYKNGEDIKNALYNH